MWLEQVDFVACRSSTIMHTLLCIQVICTTGLSPDMTWTITISFSYHKSPQTSRCKKRKCWYAFNLFLCASACKLLLRCLSHFCAFVWTLYVARVLLQMPAAYTLASTSAREGTKGYGSGFSPKPLVPAILTRHAGPMYLGSTCTALMYPQEIKAMFD